MTLPPTGRTALDRRTFLELTGAALASGAILGSAGAELQPIRADRTPGRARRLIMLIADGLSMSVPMIVDAAKQRRDGTRSRWLEWLNDPDVRSALVDTTPAGGLVTDSAAAASAWGIGEKTQNGAISMTPDGNAPVPLFRRARRAGRRAGLVTTSYLTDATPAAMFCNAPDRSQRADIAKQMLRGGLDLGIGGGRSDFSADDLRAAGAHRADSIDELRAIFSRADGRPVFGLLADDVLPHALEREAREPTLRDLSTLAVEAMEADSPNGYCLMIENENTDEAGHGNDAGSCLHDALDFEEALDFLITHARGRDDTLLVVATDHACGGPGFIAAGRRGEAQLDALIAVNHSFAWIGARVREHPRAEQTGAALAAIMRQATGVTLDDADIAMLDRAMARGRVDPFRAANRLTSVMGSLLANHLGVSFSTPGHSNDLILASAMGPGSDRLPVFCHQTALHDLMAQSLGLDG